MNRAPRFAVPLLLCAAFSARSASAQDSVRVSVEVEGLEGDLATNVQTVVVLAQDQGQPLSSARARTLYRRAEGQIRTALEPFGRYAVTIDSDLVDEGQEWSARFSVDPGPATTIANVDFALTGEGQADSGFVALADSFPIAPGDTLLHAPYEAAKADFLRYAINHGYFDARFDSAQIRVDRGASSADIVFHFSTGSRYRFGPIRIEQGVLDPRYVEAYVTAVEGEPFDAAILTESQVALTSGPWFGRADIDVDVEGAQDMAVPVTFELAPSRTQRYEAKAGYGTDTGVRGTLGATFRRLNRHGHNAELEARVSQIQLHLAARYNIPRPFPSTATYSVFGSFGDVSPTWSSTLVGTVGLSRSDLRGPVRETLSLQWEGSKYEAAAVEGTASLVVPQIEWSWVEANDRVLVTDGHRLDLRLAGGHRAVLSTATFLSARVNAKLVRSLLPRTRLIVRAEVGQIVTDDLTDLPPTRRFVTGGDQSIRGFGYESLGPVNVEGGLIGGKSLLVGGVEADVEVAPSWRLAGFVDVGNAADSFADIDFQTGVGAGIRWASPLGLVRLDVGFPVSDPNRTFRVHFMIGPDL